MKFTVCNDYLIFPVYTRAAEKTLTFSQKGEYVFSLDIRLDNVSPDFYAYIDVSLFKGESLEITVTPEMPILFGESDRMEIDNLYRETDRPQAHFTVKNGWMGVPEALIRAEDGYALLYPCNPADTGKGNAHFGYAVSRDLVHWTEQRLPLLPENESVVLRRQARAAAEKMRGLRFLGAEKRADVFSLVGEDGERKWVSLQESGAYLVGALHHGVFTAEQDEKIFRYGASDGAGVTFAEADRVLRMEWDSCRTARFCGQMSVPMELSLKKDTDGYALSAEPIGALETLYKNTNRYENVTLGRKEIPLADAAHLIRLKGGAAKEGTLSVVLFGREMRVDFAENRIFAGGSECPLSVTDGALDLVIAVDRLGAEIFADGGRIYMSCMSKDMMIDRNLLSVALRSDMPYDLDLLEIHSLESVW